MATSRLLGPMLQPRVTVLVRPSGEVQLGWDPDDALLLRPAGLSTETVLAFLRLLDGLQTVPQIIWRAGEFHIDPVRAHALLVEIGAAGLLEYPDDPPRGLRAVRVHGFGPLSDAVAAGLRRTGLRPIRSRGADVAAGKADLVVLTDALVPDPRLVNELLLHRIPHLPVRIRNNKGMVGPLVLPGETSCLRCTDLTRADYDAAWPHLAAQLLDRVGYASPAGIAATSALALTQLETIAACSTAREPTTLNTTVELHLDSHLIELRRWPRHPACGCEHLTRRREP
ncbi:hypothetical protein [Nocardia sp. NPDC052566]|uniref:hypothetical protein n=1 Tax=Nocardia sp. NPDC052566 TaxID=3364330 RepID=UPI0037C9906D